MALRLSGQLLLGASRIYWRKARYLLEDCSETLDRLKLNFKADGQVDMPQDQSRAPISSITLATNYTAAANNLMLPEPDLDLDEMSIDKAIEYLQSLQEKYSKDWTDLKIYEDS